MTRFWLMRNTAKREHAVQALAATLPAEDQQEDLLSDLQAARMAQACAAM